MRPIARSYVDLIENKVADIGVFVAVIKSWASVVVDLKIQAIGSRAVVADDDSASAADALIDEYLSGGGHFDAMTGGHVNSIELIAALINQKDNFVEGIRFAQSVIDGSASILILKNHTRHKIPYAYWHNETTLKYYLVFLQNK